MSWAEHQRWHRELAGLRDPAALAARFAARVRRPQDVGPGIADRLGEQPEDLFLGLAEEDDAFREVIEQALRIVLAEEAPESEGGADVLRAAFRLVDRLALQGTFSAIRSWLSRNGTWAAGAGAATAERALHALAVTQRPGVEDLWRFWLRLWQGPSTALHPAAFIGLRLQSPVDAAGEIPRLVERAGDRCGPMLDGMWQQPDARQALVERLRDGVSEGVPWARSALAALEARLEPEELIALRHGLAAHRAEDDDWLLDATAEEATAVLGAQTHPRLAEPPVPATAAADLCDVYDEKLAA